MSNLLRPFPQGVPIASPIAVITIGGRPSDIPVITGLRSCVVCTCITEYVILIMKMIVGNPAITAIIFPIPPENNAIKKLEISPNPINPHIALLSNIQSQNNVVLFMGFNFDFFTFYNKLNRFGIVQNVHNRFWYVSLKASRLMMAYSNRKFCFILFPFRHNNNIESVVFIFSTWINNRFIYHTLYYIHVDNTINPRQEKGKEIALNPNVQILRINDFTYHVKSQTTKREYDVIHTEQGWICTCPDHQFRKVCCKHIHAVEFSLKLRQQVREKNKLVIEQIDCSKCVECQSTNIVKHGIRHNKSGDIQRFSCKDCGKWFIFNIGFERMGANPKAITSAMQLYFTGESLRNVRQFLKLQGVDVSHMTVYNWIKKYTGLMEKYLEKITPQVGDTWRADEVWVKVKGDMKYLFALMDDETRFWIAKEVSDKKEGHDAKGLFQEAKQATKTIPKLMITDGLQSYKEAFNKEFFTQKGIRSVHLRHIRLQGDMNNNKMERMNGEFRDREKVARGLKKDDSVLINGYQIYHNYIRPHMSLDGKTPSEACGITIQGDDKWKTLIQRASL